MPACNVHEIQYPQFSRSRLLPSRCKINPSLPLNLVSLLLIIILPKKNRILVLWISSNLPEPINNSLVTLWQQRLAVIRFSQAENRTSVRDDSLATFRACQVYTFWVVGYQVGSRSLEDII